MPLSDCSEAPPPTEPTSSSSGPDILLRECKWCLRTSDSENPLIYQRAKRPRLPWRRAKGRECANCPWVLQSIAEAVDDKEKYLQKLESDPGARAEYKTKVHVWQKRALDTETGICDSSMERVYNK